MLARLKAHQQFSPKTVLDGKKREGEINEIKEILSFSSLPKPNLFFTLFLYTISKINEGN